MGCVYMINKDSRNRQQCAAVLESRMVVLADMGRESLFHMIRRIYKVLDDWKSAYPETPLLLSVDSQTAKIVNSYFYEMSDKEYQNFSMKEGEVRKYSY